MNSRPFMVGAWEWHFRWSRLRFELGRWWYFRRGSKYVREWEWDRGGRGW